MIDKDHNINNDINFDSEKRSEFWQGIVNAFDTFVVVFKKNGLATVTFILVLFMIFYSYILHPIDINKIVTEALQKEDAIRTEQIEKSIEQRFEADKIINGIMTDIVDNYNVNRCLLFEIHNGTQNLSGIEYLFYSVTNEVINNKNENGQTVYDLDYTADNFQKQHVANFIGQVVYNRLKHEKYLYFPNLENYHRTSYRFLNKLHNNGAESVMIIPFLSNNIPMVILVLTSKDPEMESASIYNYVERFRPQIEKYLMNIIP